MKNKKRILAFWLAFSMAFSLGGCGVENSENEKSKHWEKLKAENAESSGAEGISDNTDSIVSNETSDDSGKADTVSVCSLVVCISGADIQYTEYPLRQSTEGSGRVSGDADEAGE